MKFFLRRLKQSISIGLILGLICGLFFSIYTILINNLSFKENFFLTFYFLMCFILLTVLISIGYLVFFYKFRNFRKKCFSLSMSLILAFILARWVQLRIIKTGVETFLGIFIYIFFIAIGTLILFFLIYKLPLYIFNKKIQIYFITGLLILIILISVIQEIDFKSGEEINVDFKKPNQKIIVLGMDGLSWNVINPLIKEGKLPNIANLINKGSSGIIKCSELKYLDFSSALWNSIATGKSVEKHGIKDFTSAYIPFFNINFKMPLNFNRFLSKISIVNEIPISSNLRKSKAIWNILSDFNITSAIVGWWASFPPEKIKGYIVSDTLTRTGFNLKSEKIKGQTYPKNLFNEIRKFVRTQDSINLEELKKFMNINSINEVSRGFIDFYLADETYSNSALYIQKKYNPNIIFLYLEGSDAISHLYWEYMEPHREISQEEKNKFQDTVRNYYQYYDKKIGEFLKKTDENTIVIIVSDSGFGWGRYKEKIPWHNENGVIIISGKNIKQGINNLNCKQLDIVPTILYLSDLPIGKDMDGNVIINAINSKFLKDNVIEYIKTYETGKKKRETIKIDEGSGEQLKDRLRELGYVI